MARPNAHMGFDYREAQSSDGTYVLDGPLAGAHPIALILTEDRRRDQLTAATSPGRQWGRHYPATGGSLQLSRRTDAKARCYHRLAA